jgi:hypothetical protein
MLDASTFAQVPGNRKIVGGVATSQQRVFRNR